MEVVNRPYMKINDEEENFIIKELTSFAEILYSLVVGE